MRSILLESLFVEPPSSLFSISFTLHRFTYSMTSSTEEGRLSLNSICFNDDSLGDCGK